MKKFSLLFLTMIMTLLFISACNADEIGQDRTPLQNQRDMAQNVTYDDDFMQSGYHDNRTSMNMNDQLEDGYMDGQSARDDKVFVDQDGSKISSLVTYKDSENVQPKPGVNYQMQKVTVRIGQGQNIEKEIQNQTNQMTANPNTTTPDTTQQQAPTTQQQAQPVPTKEPTTAQAPAPKPETQQQAPEKNQAEAAPQQAAGSSPEFINEVIQLTNAERQKNGLSALSADSELNNAAQLKSEDMSKNNYFSHTSPTYGSPFQMLKGLGIEYDVAAENIAAGQQSPQAVVNAWMNSEGHRANIMNKDITHIGVGWAKDGNYWTQLFIKK